MAVNFRTFVIANPSAAAGAVKEEWEMIERLLRTNLPEFDYAFTEGPGHATLLAREALRAGWEMIVSIGGDGTLNEVVNGFFESPSPEEMFSIDDEGWLLPKEATPTAINPDAVLGIVPLGTGGDFRRTVGLMGSISDTIMALQGRETRQIDLGQIGFVNHSGKINVRYFINIAAAGLSGRVDEHVNNTSKALGGRLSFIIGTTRAFAGWRNVEVEVRLDETRSIRDRMQNIVVANGQYFGAGMWIAPGAQLSDGALQVVLMRDLSIAEAFRILPRLYDGTHLASKDIERYRARRVCARVIDDKKSFPLDIDGEAPGGLPATWSVLPAAMRLKV